jgi:predicted metal-dependent hydrolase
LPPDGRIRVSAPERMTETSIRMAVISRIPWIKKQRRDFEKQPRQSEREFVSGECHYLWGKRYRLNVNITVATNKVQADASGKIQLSVKETATLENKIALLDNFYRSELKSRIEMLLPIWQSKIDVEANSWGVKKMKTKWGSCNISAKRIWLNLELAKKPPECLEYILVHELVHLHERHHNERFKNFMNRHLPDWRERRDLLNNMPLAHGDWAY